VSALRLRSWKIDITAHGLVGLTLAVGMGKVLDRELKIVRYSEKNCVRHLLLAVLLVDPLSPEIEWNWAHRMDMHLVWRRFPKCFAAVHTGFDVCLDRRHLEFEMSGYPALGTKRKAYDNKLICKLTYLSGGRT